MILLKQNRIVLALLLIGCLSVLNISYAKTVEHQKEDKTNVNEKTDINKMPTYRSAVKIYMIFGFEKDLMAKATIGNEGGYILKKGDTLPTGEKVISVSYDEVIVEKNNKISKIKPTPNVVKIPRPAPVVNRPSNASVKKDNQNGQQNVIQKPSNQVVNDISVEDIALPQFMPVPSGTTNTIITPDDAMKMHNKEEQKVESKVDDKKENKTEKEVIKKDK